MPKNNTHCVRKENEIKLLIKKLGAPWEKVGRGNYVVFHSSAE